ncbi:MAG: hypothetical protein ACN6RJ_01175 [Stenotrophomonas sp.]
MLPATVRRLAILLFERGVLQQVFENARNLAVASLITAAGLEVVRSSPGELDLANPSIVGYFVTAIGAGLLLLNLSDGLWRLGKLKSHLTLQLLLCAAYVFITLRVAQLVLSLKATSGLL